jgi:predicted DNA-binding protein (MmcQ/YjbR family)
MMFERIAEAFKDFGDWLLGEESEKVIKHEDDKWVLYSNDGSKKLGSYDTEEEAKKRERQIAFFRNQKDYKPGWDETPAQFRYRVRDPGQFRDGTLRTMALPGTKGVQMIVGRLKPENVAEGHNVNSAVTQAIHFSKENWSADQAKKWITDHPDIKAVEDSGIKVIKR